MESQYVILAVALVLWVLGFILIRHLGHSAWPRSQRALQAGQRDYPRPQ